MGGNIWANNIDATVDRLIERVNKLQKAVDSLTKTVNQLVNSKAGSKEAGH